MKYRTFAEFAQEVKKDFFEDRKEWKTTSADWPLERILMLVANFTLVLAIFYAATKLLGQHVSFVKDYFDISFPLLVFAFEKLTDLGEDLLNFRTLERFKITELKEFDYRASLGLYGLLILVNLAIIVILLAPQIWNRFHRKE